MPRDESRVILTDWNTLVPVTLEDWKKWRQRQQNGEAIIYLARHCIYGTQPHPDLHTRVLCMNENKVLEFEHICAVTAFSGGFFKENMPFYTAVRGVMVGPSEFFHKDYNEAQELHRRVMLELVMKYGGYVVPLYRRPHQAAAGLLEAAKKFQASLVERGELEHRLLEQDT